MKKYIIFILLIFPITIFSNTSLNRRSYLDFGLKIGNSLYYLNNTISDKFYIGHELSIGMEWSINSNILAVDFPSLGISINMYSFNNNLYSGIDLNISFLSFSVGAHKKKYNYYIDLLGFGIEGFFFFSEDIKFPFKIYNTVILPLGFKILWKNRMYFAIEHRIFTPLLKLEFEGYDFSIILGKRFNI